MALGQQLIKNVFSSWAGYLIRIIITFFFVPYITAAYGDARYGVWVIIFQTINYFSLLDVGMSSALMRYISRFLSRRDYPAINRVLGTSNLLYFAVGTVAFGGIYLFALFLFDYFKIGDPALVEEGRSALMLLAVYSAFSFYLLPSGNSLSAFQRHDIVRFLAVVEEVVRVLIMVWLIKNGYGLVSLVLVILAMSILKHLAGNLWLRKLHREVRFSPKLAERDTAAMLLKYSRVSFGITVGWLVIFNTDTFLLGMLTSSAAAGIFNPAAQLMLYLRNVVGGIGTPLVPVISHLESEDRWDRIREIYLKGLKYVSFASFFLTTGVLLYARPFVDLWLAPEFAESATAMMILSVGTAIFLPQIIGNSVLFGVEKHRYILQVLIFEVAAKIILAVALVPRYGIIGMAIANATPQVIFYLTLYPAYMARVLGLQYGLILWTGLKAGLPATAVTLASGWLMLELVPPGDWSLFACNLLIVTAVVAIPGFMIIELDDRARVRERFGRGK